MSVNVDASEWRLQTEGGIPYKLLEGYPKGSVQGEVSDRTEQYIIRTSDYEAFMAESFPPMETWPGGIWEYSRNRPAPGSTSLRTKKVDYESLDLSRPCDIEGSDAGAPTRTYSQFLRLTIEYTNTDPVVDVSSDVSAEFLMVGARSGALWLPSNDPVEDINIPASKIVPCTEWTLRLNRVSEAAGDAVIAAARSRLGKINSDPMTILKGAAARTVLFLGYSTRQEFSWRGSNHIEMELKFLEKRIEQDGEILGHNYFYRPDKGEFQLLEMDYRRVYEVTDLNAIGDLESLATQLGL